MLRGGGYSIVVLTVVVRTTVTMGIGDFRECSDFLNPVPG